MKTVINLLRKILTTLMAVITGLNVVTIVLQVMFRYFLKKPIAWTNELAGISLVWITFLGAALATIDESHIGFDGIIEKLAPLPRLIMRIACNGLMAVACYVIIRYGITGLRVGLKTSLTALPGNVAVSSCIIPISGVIMLFALVWNTIRDIMNYSAEKHGFATDVFSDTTAIYDDVPEEIMERSLNAMKSSEEEDKK